jgi:predicted amidophosphoribosyltransferase
VSPGDSRRFVWPPIAPDQTAAEPRPPTRPAPNDSPRAPVARASAAEPARPTSTADIGSLWGPRPPAANRLWASIEHVWLGLPAPPLPDRCAAAGLAPDVPDDYCPRCGRTTAPGEHNETPGCRRCAGKRPPWTRIVRLGEYTGPLREIVHDVKFTAWRRLGEDLGWALGGAIQAALDAEGRAGEPAAIVPMATTFRRRMYRGIDHALAISRGVSRRMGYPIVRALGRTHGPSQLSVPLSRRRANVAGRFYADTAAIPEETLAILIDDVMTSGATVAAACRALGAVRGPGGRRRVGGGPWVGVAAVAGEG